MFTYISGFRKLIQRYLLRTILGWEGRGGEGRGVKNESFEMSLFYFPSDPKGQCRGCIDNFERAIGNIFTVIDYYAENVST